MIMRYNDLLNFLSFSVPITYADDTHITYTSSGLLLIQSSLPWKAKQMACVWQTYLERYKNEISVDRLQLKIKYSIWCTRTLHW